MIGCCMYSSVIECVAYHSENKIKLCFYLEHVTCTSMGGCFVWAFSYVLFCFFVLFASVLFLLLMEGFNVVIVW